MDNTERSQNHFDQPSKKFAAMSPAHFQAEGAPPVDPYIRAGWKPDLVKAKRNLWKKFRTIVGV